MDTGVWIDRIEQVVDDPAALEEVRREVAEDGSLSESDRRVLDGRIATYLADGEREAGVEPMGGV